MLANQVNEQFFTGMKLSRKLYGISLGRQETPMNGTRILRLRLHWTISCYFYIYVIAAVPVIRYSVESEKKIIRGEVRLAAFTL